MATPSTSAATTAPTTTYEPPPSRPRETAASTPTAIDTVQVASSAPLQAATQASAPRTAGIWGETFVERALLAGEVLKPATANGQDPTFATLDEATAWAGILVAQQGLDGAAIIERDGRFSAIGIDVDTMVGRRFTRSNVEGGFDRLKQADMPNVRAFITEDGYRAPVTRDVSRNPADPVYVVEPSRAGGYWHAASLPKPEAYRGIIEARDKGTDLGLNKDAGLALFKGMIKSAALAQLDQNMALMTQAESDLTQSVNQPNAPVWRQLRATIAADQALAQQQRAVERQIHEARSADLHRAEMMTSEDFREIEEGLGPEKERLAAIVAARAELRRGNPGLAVLDTDNVDLDKVTNAQLLTQIKEGMVDVRQHVVAAKQSIHTDDMPLNELAPVVQSVVSALDISAEAAGNGDVVSEAALEWLSDQKFNDRLISLGGAGVSLGLGVGALLTGGSLGVALGLSGSAVGFGTAVYDFERSDDLYTAAEAGKGGHHLIANPDDAAFHRTMAIVNLVIGGADLAIAARAAAKMSKGATALEALSTEMSAERAAEVAENYGRAKLTLDDILLDTTGTGAPRRELRMIASPATSKPVDLSRMTEDQLIDLFAQRFPKARLEKMAQAAPRIAGEGGQAPEFYRTVSRAELEELLSTGLMQPPGMTGRATDVLTAASLDELPQTLADNLKISLDDAKALANMEPGVARSQWLLDNVDHQLLADAHNQHANWFSFMSPFKSVSMGPHYAPDAGNFAVRVFDTDGSMVKTLGGEYEGEWLFTGTLRAQDIGEVLTPQQFASRYPSSVLSDIGEARDAGEGAFKTGDFAK